MLIGIGDVNERRTNHQKSYEMPPKEGIGIAHFLTVADVERSARYYEKVFGARILTVSSLLFHSAVFSLPSVVKCLR
jgi:catechol-2,3-dioxygenase